MSIAGMCCSMLVAGQPNIVDLDNKSLYSLSLAQLMDIKVTTASKFEESLHDAHASVSIITSAQTELFGGQNLYEILERIVSVNSNFGVLTSISTRGSRPWISLAQHLGLINGRPFGNMSGAHSLYTSMPLSAVERIEYIRGPGSVLYGSNAYQGVFNIITKKARRDGWQALQKLTLGSFDTKLLDGSYQYRQDNFEFALNILFNDVGGWQAKMFDPAVLQTYSRKAFQEEQTFHVQLAYKNLSFSYYDSRQERFGNYWDAPEENYIPWSKVHPAQFFNLSYHHEFNKNWRLESHITHIEKTMEWSSDGVADEFVRIKSPFSLSLYEVNVFAELANSASLISGVTYEKRKIFDAATIPDSSEDYASLYFQFRQQFYHAFSYSIAGQYVTSLDLLGGAGNKSDFVPRFGLLYDFDDKWAVKFLYGQAYRQPTAGERSIETPGVQMGSPDLDSETITTKEVQLFYRGADRLFTLSYYHSEEKDLISLVSTGDPVFPLANKNQGRITSRGVELAFKYEIDDSWYLEFSGAWQTNKDDNGVNNTNLAPNYSWKLGLGYNLNTWSFGLYNLHYSNYHDSILFDANRELVNPAADGFDWLTLKASKELAAFSNGSALRLSLVLKNILDQEIYQPNDTPVFYPINTLPGRESSSAFVSLSYQY
ncbi:TonB-dependent receptor [Thalassomonas haliotis]|uniref:TonB-dependent receptor n=2 Tax=Thalassomonas haliotis TaxID=485448 RepID=A0ABY7VHR3_9GAMM|nr:TonB-dependent receptor [Thalassomonas haliotis]